MNDGYAVAVGSVYQGGSWDHDDDWNTPSVPAVFKSTNDGVSWNRSALNTFYGYAYCIAVHPTNTNTIYAGGRYRNAGDNWVAGLFKSTDGGASWSDISASISAGRLNDLKFDPFNIQKIFAGTDYGVFVSTNGGSNWHSPSRSMHVTCITVDPTTNNKLFAGTAQGVYTSTDGGSSWNEMNLGLFDDDVNCMDFDATNGVLYIGTDGGGVFRSSVGTGIEDETIHNDLPAGFALYQNFPNPFNMSTEIHYELHRSGPIKLTVFDINGRLVRKLVDTYQEAGIRRVVWDGKNFEGRVVSSGLYIYKLQTADHVEMKKMVLQK